MMVHDDVQTDKIEIKNAEIQATVTMEEASTDINTKIRMSAHPQMIWVHH